MGLLQVAGEKYSHVNRCLRHDRNKGPMFARYNMLPVHYGVRFLFFFLLLYFLLNIRCTFERGMSMGILSENTFPIALSTLVNIDNNCYDDGWEG